MASLGARGCHQIHSEGWGGGERPILCALIYPLIRNNVYSLGPGRCGDNFWKCNLWICDVDYVHEHFLRNISQVNATKHLSWQVKMDSGNGLVPSNVDPYHCHHMSSLDHNELDPVNQSFLFVSFQFCPKWVAPNALTLGGFLCVVVNFVVLTYYDPMFLASADLAPDHPHLPPWIWMLSAICIFLAHTLGKIGVCVCVLHLKGFMKICWMLMAWSCSTRASAAIILANLSRIAGLMCQIS